MNLWRDAGQEIDWEFVSVLGAWFEPGVINVRVGVPPDAFGKTWVDTDGHRINSGMIVVEHCEPWLLGHELGHALGFTDSTDKTKLMGLHGESTMITAGEMSQLSGR